MQQMSNEYSMESQMLSTVDEDEATIDLVEVLYLFWGHAWQILICLFLGAAIAVGYTSYSRVAPRFQATTKVYFVPASEIIAEDVAGQIFDFPNQQSVESLVADYKEVLNSRPLLQDVIDNLSLDINYLALQNMISVSNAENSRVLKITVTNTDPQKSADIANELVAEADIYFQKFAETTPPQILESAITPSQTLASTKPQYLRNALVGGLLGAVLFCGVLLVRFLMNDTFITPDDIFRTFGVRPLTTIPEYNLDNSDRAGNKGKLFRHKRGGAR